jgi:hypothetical protein
VAVPIKTKAYTEFERLAKASFLLGQHLGQQVSDFAFCPAVALSIPSNPATVRCFIHWSKNRITEIGEPQRLMPPGLSLNRVSQIIAGKRAVTGDTALRFGHWFGTDPQFWLNCKAPMKSASPRKRPGTKSHGCQCEPVRHDQMRKVSRRT